MEQIQQKLLKAAIEGDTPSLEEIHTQNPLILNRVTVGCFDETPLHVAALRGHVEFAAKLLSLNSELAQVLDSQGSSPLHLASAKGYIQIVKLLVAANPEMCTVLDRDGFNPLHLAAIKGKVEVLRELAGKMPQAALAKVNRQGETILHLCVKHFQMDALKLLVEETKDLQIQGLVNATDDYGYTILHLAVADKQIKVGKGNAEVALSLVGYDQELKSAMECVFGSTFVCKTIDAAREVCCSGHGKNGALCVLQQSIRPEMMTQEGVTKEDIERLPKYKFRRIGDFEKQNGEIQESFGGIITECDTDSPIEHVLSLENAECCICLCPYEDGRRN